MRPVYDESIKWNKIKIRSKLRQLKYCTLNVSDRQKQPTSGLKNILRLKSSLAASWQLAPFSGCCSHRFVWVCVRVCVRALACGFLLRFLGLCAVYFWYSDIIYDPVAFLPKLGAKCWTSEGTDGNFGPFSQHFLVLRLKDLLLSAVSGFEGQMNH